MTIRRREPLFLGLVLALVVSANTAPAHADHRKDALSAFQHGKKLREEGKLDEAEAEFERAVELDPSVGGFLNLGDCRAELGRPLDAHHAYDQAWQLARQKRDPREAIADRALRATEEKLGQLQITVEGDVTLFLDDEPAPDLRTKPALLMPGQHTLRVEGAGKKPATRVFTAEAGSLVELSLPPLAVEDPPPPPPPPPEPPKAPPPPPPEPRGDVQRAIGISVAGIGVVSVAVGAVFGVRALAAKSELDAACPGGLSRCPGTSKNHDPAIDDNVSTYDTGVAGAAIGIGVGTAAIGGGLLLYVLAPKERTLTTFRLLPSYESRGASSSGSLTFSGTF